MVLKKIFLTGGSGTLGSELIRIAPNYGVEFIAPRSWECNITNGVSVFWELTKNPDCDVVLHCAAETDVKAIEQNPLKACEVNVCGTLNLINYCHRQNKKLVFISTEHVFDGKQGLYHPEDKINPLSKYAKTKAAAELLAQVYDNTLIIRTSFFGHTFPYEGAFVDQWSSKDYVDIIAPKILQATLSNKKGIIHIGSKRRTIYNIAKSRRPDVKRISIKDVSFSPIPMDTSFNMERDNE